MRFTQSSLSEPQAVETSWECFLGERTTETVHSYKHLCNQNQLQKNSKGAKPIEVMEGVLQRSREEYRFLRISLCNEWKRYKALYMNTIPNSTCLYETIPNIGENEFSIFKCIVGIRKHSTEKVSQLAGSVPCITSLLQ